MGGERPPLPPIRFAELADALLARAHALVPAWLPDGVQRGHEWVCGSLRGDKGDSCSVNLTTGAWADFASDEAGGDLVSLYAAIHGLTMGKAALSVARDEGLEDVAGVQRSSQHTRPERSPAPEAPPVVVSQPARSDEGWKTVRPVPAVAPRPTFSHFHRQPADLVRASEYRLGDELHGFVVRFRTSDGGKDDLPYTWCLSERSGSCKWNWRQFDVPRPLYLPGFRLPEGRTVVVVEGERKAQVLQQLLDTHMPGVYCVVSWPGGSKAWAKADWSWLRGCSVLAWPDCDSKRVAITAKERNACADDEAALEALKGSKPFLPANKQPGMAAMLGIGALLRDEFGCNVQLLRIAEPGVMPDGWDAADAIEKDGWGIDEVLAFFGTAYALPANASEGAAVSTPAPAATAATSAAGKKIDGPGAPGGGGDDGSGGLPGWLACFWDDDRRRWFVSRKLVIAALRNDPELVGVLGFNELSNTMEARRPWPFPQGRAGQIQDATDLLLGDWLSQKYGLPSITRQAITEAVQTVAHEFPWHPVKDWIRSLKWDGRKRLDRWLAYVIGEHESSIPSLLREYLSAVGRMWLVGMVRRVFEPGCQFDYCPVLEGKGGLGKSTMVKVLAGPGWHSDTPFEIGKGKEGGEQVQGIWLYELGELSQMGKSTVEAVKQFISSTVDRYRPAYGRVLESHPRQCVLVGTTNESTYLRDRTGNRRFWPIPVRHRIRNDWLEARRDQLFAEAYQAYLEGARSAPSPEDEDRLFRPMQEARVVETAVTSELLNLLTRQPTDAGLGAVVNTLSEFVTLGQLVLALGLDAGKSNAGLEAQIRGWMAQQGWEHKKRQVNGVRGWGWVRPAGWPAPDTDDDGADAGPLAGRGDDAPF